MKRLLSKIIEYLKIYFLFIYEEYLQDDMDNLNLFGKISLFPVHIMRIVYYYIFPIIFTPYFILSLVQYDQIEEMQEELQKMMTTIEL